MTSGRPHWWPAYVGIGSNLQEPRQQVMRAFEALARIPDSRLIKTSRLYRSPPMDGSDQPDYINAVAALLTRLDALTLLHQLQAIEKNQGRARQAKRWGPRSLDLDLLVFGEQEICNDELIVPHPGMAKRSFVLLPLADIAPHLQVPGLALVRALADKLPASDSVDTVTVD
jgi:2-amino-4-hydroxy-6-hydroxymethyldihydropteridine diphosphokinase